MNKNVYLFEMDSVRKTDEEIVKAQQTLYDEIVGNGNVVVMTFNQVVDSRSFFCLLNNQDYYQSIIQLFQNGKIKVSQYGDTRTLSQYLLNSLDTEKEFIYSALPVKGNQKRLLALMRRSLMYSDLSEINGYRIYGHRTNEELHDLFIELNEYKDEENIKTLKEEESKLTDEQMREILDNLYWLLSCVMKLSPMHDIYLSPRETTEYENLKLYNYLKAAVNLPENDSLWNQSMGIIKNLQAYSQQNDNRSVYLRELKEKSRVKGDAKVYYYAEAIINQCYNYACEASICNTSKHYNIEEIRQNRAEKPTFQEDFCLRLQEDWYGGEQAEKRYMTDETNGFAPFACWKKIPKFQQAVRLSGYEKKKHDVSAGNDIPRYEFEADRQQKEHKRTILRRIAIKGGFSLLCIVIACMLELIFTNIQDLVGVRFILSGWISGALQTILFLFVTELLTTVLQKWIHGFVPLSEAIGGVVKLVTDAIQIAFIKSSSHRNTIERDSDIAEKVSHSIPIDFVKTKEIKRYIRLRETDRQQSETLFRDSEIFSLYDMNNNAVVKSLLRNEEIYNNKYGVIYQSKFNKLLVDPVQNHGQCIPYERMTPASGYNGVVMIVNYQNKFILLNQFRHALRQRQYSFPRGFSESAYPEEDVVRELDEELHAKIKGAPYYLGRIAPDSGLTTTRAYVYYVDIESYQVCKGHEGIINTVELPRSVFEKWIFGNIIDDGYTIGAYMLFKSKEYQMKVAST